MDQKSLFNTKLGLPDDYDGLNLAELYENLPEFFKTMLRHHLEPQELLIAIYSATIISAALIPNTYTLYAGKRSYPFLFLMLLLPPANGKSALNLSRTLLKEINKMLTKEHEDALKRYQHDFLIYKKGIKSGTSISPPTPPKLQQILIAGNTTSARLILQLSDNGEDIPLIISESEIDAVTGMLKGEMGALNSVIMRLIFHNEAISSARKIDKETLNADRPKMALLLSGTENQVSSLFKGNEDGLLSRFLILDLVGNMEWVSPRPRTGQIPIEEHYDVYSHKYLKLWHQTQKLNLEIKFTEGQWDQLDEMGTSLQKLAHMVGGQYAIGLARRHVLMATRFCSVLTFFRHIDSKSCLIPTFKESLTASDTDLNISLQLVGYSFQKALALFQRMPSSPAIKTNNLRQLKFYESLQTEFTMPEVIELARRMNIPTRTKDRWLKEFVQTGALEKVERGKYRKSPMALAALAEEGRTK